MFGYALDLCDRDDAIQIVFGVGHFLGTVAGKQFSLFLCLISYLF
jgi:hypothetical protein